jgi:hypothetical protein
VVFQLRMLPLVLVCSKLKGEVGSLGNPAAQQQKRLVSSTSPSRGAGLANICEGFPQAQTQKQTKSIAGLEISFVLAIR